MFTVFDGAGFSIEGAKVVVKNLGGTIVASGLTNTAGQIDLSSLSAGSYKLLVYKSGAFKGARIDYCGAGSPASIKLVKVAQVNMSFTVYKHDTNAFVSGATVVVKDNLGQTVWSAITGQFGQASSLVTPSSFAGWTISVSAVGMDGVIIPLDNLPFSSSYSLVLEPTIGSDE
jgi:hypothetical protein